MSFVGDIIGDITGSNQAADAMSAGAAQSAEATLAATEKNIEFQEWLWGEQKALSEPYVQAGYSALDDYMGMAGQPYTMEDLYLDPGYQFRLNEGQKAYETSGAAKGMQLSGPQVKAQTRYGQDYASGEYGAAFGRRQTQLDNLYRMIAGGQAAAAGQAQQGTSMGTQVSGSIMAGGQALSNMYQQQAQASAAQAMAPWNTIMDIGQLGVRAYGAHQMSDERLKENLKHIGTLESGIKVYEYNFIGNKDKETGVIAQEVLKVIPEAVGEKDGFLTVDYSRLH
ncbi:MAG: tail fiber domain-containing protein [Gammaproteobacteria bacterium]|nr:tail fiber domain-containing protein [Gammaproteobacteria bacterium]